MLLFMKFSKKFKSYINITSYLYWGLRVHSVLTYRSKSVSSAKSQEIEPKSLKIQLSESNSDSDHISISSDSVSLLIKLHLSSIVKRVRRDRCKRRASRWGQGKGDGVFGIPLYFFIHFKTFPFFPKLFWAERKFSQSEISSLRYTVKGGT